MSIDSRCSNDALHLFQRRLNATAYKELTEAGAQIPGTKGFPKDSIRLGKL